MKRKVFYRTGAIGDVVHCLPAAKLAKEKFPEHSIEFIVGTEQLKEILDFAAPYLDQVYVFQEDKPDANPRLKDSISKNPPEELIYLHSNWIKANWLNFSVIKAKTLTLYKKDLAFNSRENFVLTVFPDLREKILAAQNTDAIFELIDHRCLSLPEGDSADTAAYVCLAPGVGNERPHRAYPMERWVELVARLLRETDLNFKILGGPDEESMSHELFIGLEAEMKAYKDELWRQTENRENEDFDRAKHEARIENLIGKTSLKELTSKIVGSKMLLAGDTGILHIASALGVKTISPYSITSELRTGPYAPEATVLRAANCKCKAKENNRSNQQKNCNALKMGYASCVWDISVDQIIDAMSLPVHA